MPTPDHSFERRAAISWAHQVLLDPTVVYLDLETTGLYGDRDEVLQAGVLDWQGNTLIDTLVRPRWDTTILDAIPERATAIHGITDAMVSADGVPTLDDLLPRLTEVLHGRRVVIYNADSDVGILRGSMARRLGQFAAGEWLAGCISFECAMREYARYRGEWDFLRGAYRWAKLVDACGSNDSGKVESAHSAIGDCRMTLSVVRDMAGGWDICCKAHGV